MLNDGVTAGKCIKSHKLGQDTFPVTFVVNTPKYHVTKLLPYKNNTCQAFKFDCHANLSLIRLDQNIPLVTERLDILHEAWNSEDLLEHIKLKQKNQL